MKSDDLLQPAATLTAALMMLRGSTRVATPGEAALQFYEVLEALKKAAPPEAAGGV